MRCRGNRQNGAISNEVVNQLEMLAVDLVEEATL